MDYYGIRSSGSPRHVLDIVVAAFSCLPYENMTKIIKRAESGSCEQARRYPEEVIHDHVNWGTGGTCFSLTSALLRLVRSLGWNAEYILADRRYGQDTHCALLLWIEDVPHLLDPGYLIVKPIPLQLEKEQRIKTRFNDLILAPEGSPEKISLHTVRGNQKKYRLTYRTSPVDFEEFCRAWDASFHWDMMQYPLLTRTKGPRQIYLRGSRMQISGKESLERQHIQVEAMIDKIAMEFTIHPSVIKRALTILKGKGDIAASKC